jgi:hypothetical protein
VVGCHEIDSFCIISDNGRDRTRDLSNTGLVLMYFISPNRDVLVIDVTVNITPALDIILVRPEDGPDGTETCCLE